MTWEQLGFRLFFACFAVLIAPSAHAVLTIEITEGVQGAIPIAVIPFAWEGAGPPPEDFAKIVANDLGRSGRFKVLPARDYENIAKPSDPSQVNFRDWRLLNQDNLLIGRVRPNATGYDVQFYLFNIFKGTQMVAFNVAATFDRMRIIGHQISDIVYETLIGQRGAFNTRIAYVTRQRGQGKYRYALVIADADGENPREILVSSTEVYSPAWSPDGTKLAYARFEGNHAVVYVQDVVSGARTIVAEAIGHNGAPAWSPDGKRLALAMQNKKTSASASNFDIYILDLQTKNLTRFTEHWAIETYPAWSPDGKYIVFTSDRSGHVQIYRKPVAGGTEERITFQGAENDRAVFSPNGKMLAMVNGNGGEYRIAVLELDTGQVRVLTEGKLDESPSFAPNGSMILYARTYRKTGEEVLSAVSVDGRFDFPLSEQGTSVREPAWSPF